ncbi:hypothetical protein BC937DRAFT_86460, partial [Endogone sp. FLAS-F59071]
MVKQPKSSISNTSNIARVRPKPYDPIKVACAFHFHRPSFQNPPPTIRNLTLLPFRPRALSKKTLPMNSTAQKTRVTSPGPASPLSLGSPPRTPRSSLGSSTSPRGGGTPRSSSPEQSHLRPSVRTLSPPLSPSSSGNDVFSRLTNTKGYTGLHKHRFDEEGRGLGKAGREVGCKTVDGCYDPDIVIDDGSTPSVSRSKRPIAQPPLHVSISRGPVVRGPALGTQKFGTQ